APPWPPFGTFSSPLERLGPGIIPSACPCKGRLRRLEAPFDAFRAGPLHTPDGVVTVTRGTAAEAGMRYRDRFDAGRRLVDALDDLRGRDVLVLGLPRGGVPVAYEVARALDAPLDVAVARKLGAPGQPELGIGAISQGVTVIDEG